MAKSERELANRTRRLLPCPQCSGEVERDRCMCDWCGALVHLSPREDAFRLEGVVCFTCGYGNPGSERRRECAQCGHAFAATCPGCAAPVPLARRCCSQCGMSVEEFDAERTRLEVIALQERRHGERGWLSLFRWQVLVGIALVALGLLVGRVDRDLRRPLVGAGIFNGAFGLFPLGLARLSGRRLRRLEA
jgi:hypothetical protein